MFDPTKAGNYVPPKINSKVPSKEYKENWDKIFGNTKADSQEVPQNPREVE